MLWWHDDREFYFIFLTLSHQPNKLYIILVGFRSTNSLYAVAWCCNLIHNGSSLVFVLTAHGFLEMNSSTHKILSTMMTMRWDDTLLVGKKLGVNTSVHIHIIYAYRLGMKCSCGWLACLAFIFKKDKILRSFMFISK